MLLKEIVVDFHHLKEYASTVVRTNEARAVYLVGSATHKVSPNDVDLLYVLPISVGLVSSEEAEDAVRDFIESTKNINLDTYDSFFQSDERFFYVARGAGRDVVENTDYGKLQSNKKRVRLA